MTGVQTCALPILSDAERIEEALELIENEYAQTGYVPEDETEVYVLSGGRLIETR